MPKPSDCDRDLTTFLAVRRAEARSPKTLRNYDDFLTKLHGFLGHPLVLCTRAEAVAWLEHLATSHKPAGVRTHVKHAQAFFNWLVAEEIIDRSPFARLRVSVPEEVKRTPKPEAISAIIDCTRSKRDRAILTLFADTGARKREVASVKVEDVDMDHGVIYFRESKTRKRPVTMSPRLIAALGRWLRVRQAPTDDGLWASRNPYELVGQVVERCSGATLSPHALRRAFAVEWLSKGGSEIGLQRVAGWRGSQMIGHYTAARADELALSEHRRLMAV